MTKSIAAILLVLGLLRLATPARAEGPEGRPDEGYTTRPTRLLVEPKAQSTSTETLPAHQKLDIEATSPDRGFFYVEVDRDGPDARGWVPVRDVEVTEYE